MAENERVEELLEELVRWTKIVAAPTVRGWLEPVLTTTDERKVYQASTGGTTREVAAVAGVSHVTVGSYWKRWKSARPPILQEGGRKGRYERLYDLAEMNLPLEVGDGV